MKSNVDKESCVSDITKMPTFIWDMDRLLNSIDIDYNEVKGIVEAVDEPWVHKCEPSKDIAVTTIPKKKRKLLIEPKAYKSTVKTVSGTTKCALTSGANTQTVNESSKILIMNAIYKEDDKIMDFSCLDDCEKSNIFDI